TSARFQLRDAFAIPQRLSREAPVIAVQSASEPSQIQPGVLTRTRLASGVRPLLLILFRAVRQSPVTLSRALTAALEFCRLLRTRSPALVLARSVPSATS